MAEKPKNPPEAPKMEIIGFDEDSGQPIYMPAAPKDPDHREHTGPHEVTPTQQIGAAVREATKALPSFAPYAEIVSETEETVTDEEAKLLGLGDEDEPLDVPESTLPLKKLEREKTGEFSLEDFLEQHRREQDAQGIQIEGDEPLNVDEEEIIQGEPIEVTPPPAPTRELLQSKPKEPEVTPEQIKAEEAQLQREGFAHIVTVVPAKVDETKQRLIEAFTPSSKKQTHEFREVKRRDKVEIWVKTS